jgi:hypothetical protein
VKPAAMLVQTDNDLGAFGDCARACVASIFELPSEEVPHFCRDGLQPPGPGGELPWVVRLKEWLRARGMAMFVLIANNPSEAPHHVMNFHYMVCARTALGADHWVVYFAGRPVHDPHPASGWLIDSFPQTILIFVKS